MDKKRNAVIVLPTYNEAQNIEKIIKSILKQSDNCDENIHILVVDDNSPDQTWKIVEKISKNRKNVHLLKREKKKGLGGAYIFGFKYGLNKLNADLLFNMDADLSHNPKLLPLFLKESKKYDVIIGSRYVKGGGFINWPLSRKIISKGANLFGKILLGVKVKDISSGYRCYNKEIIEKIELDSIKSQGYAFLEEILFKCVKNGAKIKEIPLVFVDREYGETKLDKKEIIKFFVTILRIRLKNGN